VKSFLKALGLLTALVACLYAGFTQPATLRDLAGPVFEIVIGVLLLLMTLVTFAVCAKIPAPKSNFNDSLLGRRWGKAKRSTVGIVAFLAGGVFNTAMSKQIDLMQPKDFFEYMWELLKFFVVCGAAVHWCRLALELAQCGRQLRKNTALRLINLQRSAYEDGFDRIARFIVETMAHYQLCHGFVFIGVPMYFLALYGQLVLGL